MGVRLFFNVDEMPLVEEGVADERALLELARGGSENAAAELLLKYENGEVRDPVVRNWIVLGHSLVAKQLATAALRKKKTGRSETKNPLNYFGHVNAPGTRGVKPDADGRLRLLMEAGDRLSADDVEDALKLAVERRGQVPNPVQIHRLEKMLADYVQSPSFCAGASEPVAVAFVQHSFPHLPWDSRDAAVSYGPA